MIRLQSRFFMQAFRSFLMTIALMSATIAPGLAQTRSILRIGAQGAEVTELQSTLKLLGYFVGSVNGMFEASTEQAVKQFQQAAGVGVDGVVGAETWNRLFPASEPVASTSPTPVSRPRPEPAPTGEFPVLRRGARGDAVQGLQSRLRAIGLYDGEVDGVFGAGTEAAVKAAQAKFGLTVDGVVGGATWAAILR